MGSSAQIAPRNVLSLLRKMNHVANTSKRIIVSVTNDLVSDNRVHKVCSSLQKMGFEILLLGRKLPHSSAIKRSYSTRRLRLLFNKGPLFYAEYNFRVFLLLLFAKCDILLANDLDSLPANFLASKIRNKTLVYDSHEYFTEVPELINRPKVQRIWEALEQKMLPKLENAYTVCHSIAAVYAEKYGTEFRVVRNLPLAQHTPIEKQETPTKIILYQGAVNIARGLKQAILAMHYVEHAKLVIAGDGDIKSELEKLVRDEKLGDKVEFTGRLPLEKLAEITAQADLGISVEEDYGLNYRFALPNKLFDYIQSQIPVLVSNLPEMSAVVKKYQVGEITPSLAPEILAKKMTDCLTNNEKRKLWKTNVKTAAQELVWENEEKILAELFLKI